MYLDGVDLTDGSERLPIGVVNKSHRSRILAAISEAFHVYLKKVVMIGSSLDV